MPMAANSASVMPNLTIWAGRPWHPSLTTIITMTPNRHQALPCPMEQRLHRAPDRPGLRSGGLGFSRFDCVLAACFLSDSDLNFPRFEYPTHDTIYPVIMLRLSRITALLLDCPSGQQYLASPWISTILARTLSSLCCGINL